MQRAGKIPSPTHGESKLSEIDKWYADQDEEHEDEIDRKRNECQFEEACEQLDVWSPDEEFYMRLLGQLWARDCVLTIDAYFDLKEQNAARATLAKGLKRRAQVKPKSFTPCRTTTPPLSPRLMKTPPPSPRRTKTPPPLNVERRRRLSLTSSNDAAPHLPSHITR